jgi:hypothetical protein
VRDRELVTLGECLLVGLVGVPVTSSWKTVKRSRFLLRGFCEVVLEIAICGVEENLAIRKGPLSFVGLARRRRRAFVALGKSFVGSHTSPT